MLSLKIYTLLTHDPLLSTSQKSSGLRCQPPSQCASLGILHHYRSKRLRYSRLHSVASCFALAHHFSQLRASSHYAKGYWACRAFLRGSTPKGRSIDLRSSRNQHRSFGCYPCSETCLHERLKDHIWRFSICISCTHILQHRYVTSAAAAATSSIHQHRLETEAQEAQATFVFCGPRINGTTTKADRARTGVTEFEYHATTFDNCCVTTCASILQY